MSDRNVIHSQVINMKKFEVRFVSGNRFKIDEAKSILAFSGVMVVPISIKIEELQTEDTERLVRDKALKAFKNIARPLFVEHTGLYLNYLNGLPGGLTQIVWDTLLADRFSELFGKSSDTSVIAKTTLCYVDGKRMHIFVGEITGKIAASPAGNRDFQWDCVFIPDGATQTFAEMGNKKNEISMRKIALDKYAAFLKANGVR
jgi:XTP/dITP diphosphohydrolase